MPKPPKPPPSWNPITGLIAALLYVGDSILSLGDTIMTVESDLQDAVTAITGAVGAAAAALDDLAAKLGKPGVDPATVAAASVTLTTLAGNLRDAVARDDPPPAP